MVIYQLCLTRAHALVAQLDRVTGYEPVGQGFESLRAHQTKIPPKRVVFLFGILNRGTRTLRGHEREGKQSGGLFGSECAQARRTSRQAGKTAEPTCPFGRTKQSVYQQR